MNTFEWTSVVTVEQAISQLNGKAVLKAGGVDVLDMMKERLIAPSRVVNIRNIPGLDQVVEDQATGLRVGPLVTLAQLDADPIVRTRYTALAQAAGKAATPQIRNMATVGGNLLQRPRCWYFRSEQFPCRKKGGTRCFALDGENQYHAIFDNRICAIVHPSATAVALIAFGARVQFMGSQGNREVLLEEFLTLPEVDVQRENALGPDEMITEIRVPTVTARTRSVYLKQGEKESFDWPIADVAVAIEHDGQRCQRASIILGAAAPVPKRAKEAEAVLVGQVVNEATARIAARAAVAEATPLSQNAYKVPIFETLVRRAILAAVSDEGGKA